MKRAIVWVSILLLLLVGIPLIVGGFWCMSQMLKYHDDTDVSLVAAVFGGDAFLIGTPFCVGAGCLAAWFKPWRSQQPTRDNKQARRTC